MDTTDRNTLEYGAVDDSVAQDGSPDQALPSQITLDARRLLSDRLDAINAEMYEITYEPSLPRRLDRERSNEGQLLDLIIEHVARPDAVDLGPVIAKCLLSRGSYDRGYGMPPRGHDLLASYAARDFIDDSAFRKALLVGATAPFNSRLVERAISMIATAAQLDAGEIQMVIADLTSHRPNGLEIALSSYPHIALDLLTLLVPRIDEIIETTDQGPHLFEGWMQRCLQQVRQLPSDIRLDATSRLLGALTAHDQLGQITLWSRRYIDEINSANSHDYRIGSD